MTACYRSGRVVSITVFDNKILAALKGGLSGGDKCSLGATSVAVAPSGNLYPCERAVAEDEDLTFVMGHVDTGPSVSGEACARGPINPECADCGERWRCASFCACANYAETGRTDVAGGTQCWHERQTALLADRIASTLWEEQNALFIAWFYGRMTGAATEEKAERARSGAAAQGAKRPEWPRSAGRAEPGVRATEEKAERARSGAAAQGAKRPEWPRSAGRAEPGVRAPEEKAERARSGADTQGAKRPEWPRSAGRAEPGVRATEEKAERARSGADAQGAPNVVPRKPKSERVRLTVLS